MTASVLDAKEQAYAALVHARKQCSLCPGLVNPSVCEDGRFDTDNIGSWSDWQGNLNAPVMLIGQDWGDVAWFIREEGRPTNTSRTNTTLLKLFASIGLDVRLPKDTVRPGALFFTNAILCLKQGGAQAKVREEWFRNCGVRFLRPTIDLVQPKVVICLGDRAYRAVLHAYSMRPEKFSMAVNRNEPTRVSSITAVFPVYHCGAGTQNRNRSLEEQFQDWRRIGQYLNGG
jgi:DNA polymerase